MAATVLVTGKRKEGVKRLVLCGTLSSALHYTESPQDESFLS